MTIDRNSLCSCRSGMKYKKCCMKHPERNEFGCLIGAEYIDRYTVFTDLAARSNIMTQLLRALPERMMDLVWVYLNPNLDANMRSVAGYGHYAIIIKQFPIHEEDFFDFAHELGHVYMIMQNYPGSEIISGNPSLMGLGTVLTNTLMDPIVNKFVTQWRLDIQGYMEKSFRIQIPMIEKCSHNHLWEQHYLRCLCIEKILEWRILELPIENRFLPVFRRHHPSEYEFALSFADSLELNRLSDPSYVREILKQLIRDNHMEAELRVR